MKLDRQAIALAPRTTTGCLDMAVMFYGRHLRGVGGLCVLVALPSCLLVYGLNSLYDLGLWMPALVVLIASAPLGVFLAVGAAERAFGMPFTARRIVWTTLANYKRQLLLVLLLRGPLLVAAVLGAIPGLLLGVQTGFLVEREAFRRRQQQTDEAQARKNLAAESGGLLASALGIGMFCAILIPVLFVTLDTALNLLFAYPILFGRLAGAASSPGYLLGILWYDPRVQIALTAVALLTYPVGRLAWFFCYVDLQVRRDCWDIQVEFEEEARRMNETLDRRGEAA